MPRPRKNPGASAPRIHRFVSAVQKRSNAARIVQGFVGKATTARHTRIYLDAQLARFVEIPTKSIYHCEDPRTKSGPMAPVTVWVDATTEIHHFGNWIANDDPTTMATGEEGGGDPTTMATGEENSVIDDPLDLIGNPFGSF